MPKIPLFNEKELDALLKIDGATTTSEEARRMLINVKGVCINKTPRKDGRYQGYVIKFDTKNFFYGRSREEVATKISDFIYRDKPLPKKKKTSPRKNTGRLLNSWLDEWIKLYKAPNLKPSSLSGLVHALIPVRNKFAGRPMDTLTTGDIQAFLLEIPATRARDLTHLYLSQALEKARKLQLIPRNPCDCVEIKKSTPTHKNALTREEQSVLVSAVKGTAIEPLFMLLLTSGLRIGEALALTSDDIDRSNGTVSVTKNVVFVDGKEIFQSTTKSAAGNRIVPVPMSVLNYFKDKTGRIFPRKYSGVRTAFRRLSRSANIEVSPHILRHTYATRLEESGLTPKAKQYLLGHSSVKMTQNTYTDIQNDYILTFKDKIEGLFDT